MKFKSQSISWAFFAAALGLFALQLVYGFIMGFARVGMDGLHEWIPFNVARAVHTNLLVVWLITGFMGAAYWIIPDEADRELLEPLNEGSLVDSPRVAKVECPRQSSQRGLPDAAAHAPK